MTSPARYFVLGATGGIGRRVVDLALARGHAVTAFVRSPEKLGAPRDFLTVQKGDPLDGDALARALREHDAVVSALGPPGARPPRPFTKTARVRRSKPCERRAFVACSWCRRRCFSRTRAPSFGLFGIPFCETSQRTPWPWNSSFARARSTGRLSARRASRTGRPTGKYAVAAGSAAPGGRVVSRADVADFLVQEAERGAHLRQIVGMASGR